MLFITTCNWVRAGKAESACLYPSREEDVVRRFFVRDEALDVDHRGSVEGIDRVDANEVLIDGEYPAADETDKVGSCR